MSATGTRPTIGRYVLDDLVAESAGSRMWRATDPVLHRAVGVRLLDAEDPRADALREAACLAAQVTDTRVVRILDVLDADDAVAVITEWVPGRPFAEVVAEGMTPLEAARVAREAAECLESAHAAGLGHGRLRPNSVLVSDQGDVRLRGLGVEAVLWGCDPDDDPLEADLHGVGALLYAGVTGRWPYGEADGLPTVARASGAVPWPSRVTPELPALVDELAAGMVKDAAPKRDRAPYPDLPTATAALRAAVGVLREDARATRDDDAEPAAPRRRGRWLRRVVGVLAAALGIVGLAFLGWSLLWGGPKAVTPRAALPQTAGPTPSSPAPLPSRVGEKALPVLSVRDFDPLGNGTENADLAGLAIDGDEVSAWQTVRYRADYLSGKPGVGLLLDLGTPRPVDAVKLTFAGRGYDVTIRTSEKAGTQPDQYRPFAAAIGAPERITMRTSTPQVARYVLIWLTRIPPQADGGYQGGISGVTVLG